MSGANVDGMTGDDLGHLKALEDHGFCSPYSAFARYYDRLTEDVCYPSIAERYLSIAKGMGSACAEAAELGCGTGSLSVELARRGVRVLAVDSSEEMLSVACNKALREGLDVFFVHQDIAELCLGKTVDLVVSSLDCINHLPSADAVERAFSRAFDSLSDGGVFIFDVNTVHKHRDVLADNVFIIESGGVFCSWQNFYDPQDDSVAIVLDFFEEQRDGSYLRTCEEFTERSYPLSAIKALLEGTGFEVTGIFDGITDKPAGEDCERALFAARKSSSDTAGKHSV